MNARTPLRIGIGVLVAAASLLLPTVAIAGGDFVDLAVGSSRVWFVGEPGVYALDAGTGRTVETPRLVGAAYPLSVALAGEAAWVASVENGYTDGKLTHIDIASGRQRVVWHGVVQYVAAGAGGVYAMLGDGRVALFRADGRLARRWNIPGAGRIAADVSGCWISTGSLLLHIDQAGQLHRVLRAPLGDVATGLGAVWLPRETSVLRIDEHTGRVRRLVTGRLRLGGFQHELAAADGALWALDQGNRFRSHLVRLDLASGHRTGAVDLHGIADALVVRPHALWVATVISPPYRPASGYDVIRIDPCTLRRTLLVHLV